MRATIEGLKQTAATGGIVQIDQNNGSLLQEEIGGLNPAELVTGAASDSIRLLSNTMTDLCNEMKVAQGGSLVQAFSGEGHNQFTN